MKSLDLKSESVKTLDLIIFHKGIGGTNPPQTKHFKILLAFFTALSRAKLGTLPCMIIKSHYKRNFGVDNKHQFSRRNLQLSVENSHHPNSSGLYSFNNHYIFFATVYQKFSADSLASFNVSTACSKQETKYVVILINVII